MFRSRFFWRLYATYSLLVLLMAAVIGLLIQQQTDRSVDHEIETRLFSQAAALLPLAREALSRQAPGEIQAVVTRVGAESRSRITFIRANGVVIADSEETPARMENHARRPEIVAALSGNRGTSRRFSTTVGKSMLYTARRVDVADVTLGVVRVSIPLDEIAARLVEARRVVYTGAGIGILLALLLGLVVAHRFTAPLAEMTRVSESLRQGDYGARVRLTGSDELRTLGDNLNRLARELAQRVASVTRQGAQLDAIIGSMQEGVVAIGADDRIALTNASARVVLDLEKSESLGLDALRQQHPDLTELIEEVRTSGGAARRELRTQGVDGGRFVDAHANVFDSEGEAGVLVVLHDNTALRRLEHIRSDFVANVSHELKTPLTSIQGYVETLLDGAVNDPDYNVRFLQKIEQQVVRLSALVTDLLSLARIESQEGPLQLAAIDWREIVMESIARRRDTIARKPLSLTLELGDEPVLVLAEAEGARQIIDNLLDNAINYTPEHGSVTVSAGHLQDTGFVQINDTGIGIPENLIDRIFERFYRVDRGRSRALGGTGLGLSIVRNIVQRLEGSIDMQSEVGVGTSVTVRIPSVTLS